MSSGITTALRNQRRTMVRRQIEARGVRDPRVLEAMRRVPREAFIPESMSEFAYQDSALPIAAQQTISQPYIVAYMTAALELEGGERVLEIGTGSGYGAAVLAEIASDVVTMERHGTLADGAARQLRELGYDNVRVIHGDGTRGDPESAPFDAIVVTAGGPQVPTALREQLAIGGRLVLPVGESRALQKLVRIRRVAADRYETEQLLDVCFVPLIGTAGTAGASAPQPVGPASAARIRRRAAIARSAETFDDIESADLGPLLDRLAAADVVLLGEATHGTAEFQRMRGRITRELVAEHGFDCIALEADWPDAARIDDWVRLRDSASPEWPAFARFPTWMWRNREVREFVDWLREHNAAQPPERRAGVYGLDIYSMQSSIHAVLDQLEAVDREAARVARERYACLQPWQSDPTAYGRAAVAGRYRECEADVVATLRELLEHRLEHAARFDGERLFAAEQNAHIVRNAERYYRVIYYGGAASWNLRDQHMFDTLRRLIGPGGPKRRAVVWAHNSHLGDAAATEMAARGEHNVGQLCREEFGVRARSVGFGTHFGTVAAAENWGDPVQVFDLQPSHKRSHERLFHDSGIRQAVFPLRDGSGAVLPTAFTEPRLQRMVGVVYRPDAELVSHYLQAELPRQFDEWIWFDRSRALEPLEAPELEGVPASHPFGH